MERVVEMSRYIDAEELKEQLQNFSKWCRDGRKHAVDFIVDCILPNMLIADVQEVKHLSPCDVCKYNPPSSGDGKPCLMCPACASEGGDDD